jgi:hypothetical protein
MPIAARLGDDNDAVEESPEQVLARLARYTESLRRASPSPIDGSAPPALPPALRARFAAAPPVVSPPSARVVTTPTPPPANGVAQTQNLSGAEARDWRYSAERARRLSTSALRATLFGQLLAAVACVGVVAAFVRLDRPVAYAIVAVMVAGGAIAVVRRIPLALWWTFGVLLGAMLGMWS